jgi:hypothetical protein
MVATQGKSHPVVEEVEHGQIDDIPSSETILEEREFVPARVKVPLPKSKIVTPMEGIVATEVTG